jgi:hypothetical protein
MNKFKVFELIELSFGCYLQYLNSNTMEGPKYDNSCAKSTNNITKTTAYFKRGNLVNLIPYH